MRFRTVTVREGERLGDVDLQHESFSEPPSGDVEGNQRRIDLFRAMVIGVERGEAWKATTDGGWPRVGWGDVLQVGMYDGWPYWKPMPSFLLTETLGAGWHSWRSLTDAHAVTPSLAAVPPPKSSDLPAGSGKETQQ